MLRTKQPNCNKRPGCSAISNTRDLPSTLPGLHAVHELPDHRGHAGQQPKGVALERDPLQQQQQLVERIDLYQVDFPSDRIRATNPHLDSQRKRRTGRWFDRLIRWNGHSVPDPTFPRLQRPSQPEPNRIERTRTALVKK